MEPDDKVIVTNIDGEEAHGRVVKILDDDVGEKDAPYLIADGTTLVNYWWGTDVKADERVVRVDMGLATYDYPESRVEVFE